MNVAKGFPVIAPAAGQAPASNTNAVATLAAPARPAAWHLASVAWSYSGTPTAGSITIAWGAVSETYYVTVGGPGVLDFVVAKAFPAGVAVTITLAAGGSGISGSIYPNAWTI